MLEWINNLLHIKNDVEISVSDKINILFDELQEYIILINAGEDLVIHKRIFTDTIHGIRKEIKNECGFIIPEIQIKSNLALQENEFNICVHGKNVCSRFVIPTEEGVKEEVYDALKTVIYENINEIFTNELTEKYINTVQQKNNLLIWNVTSVLSVIQIKTILSDIILKGKSINNIDYIFEKIGEQILSDHEYNNVLRYHNPHIIAKNIAKVL